MECPDPGLDPAVPSPHRQQRRLRSTLAVAALWGATAGEFLLINRLPPVLHHPR